jgi:transposase InsO family protein
LFTQADLGEIDGCQAITFPRQEAWMNVHQNARLTPFRRRELVHRLHAGEVPRVVAQQLGVSVRTARKWRARFRTHGVAGLVDRSSRPRAHPRQTRPAIALGIKVLRQQQWTCRQIATAVGVSPATAARILRKAGLSRRRQCEPPPVSQRYEHPRPGDLLHLDTKKLGRIVGVGHRITGRYPGVHHHDGGRGWEHLHIAIDDYSRVAYVELLPDDRTPSAGAFLRRAVGWFRAHGVRVRRILSDNGAAYRSDRFRATCRGLHVVPRRTRPYTPRTNGKAERFIQTALREWAYARPYYSSADRALILPGWLEHYNCARPHAGLAGLPPMTRLPEGNNLLRRHN